jgi:hypothetical protein
MGRVGATSYGAGESRDPMGCTFHNLMHSALPSCSAAVAADGPTTYKERRDLALGRVHCGVRGGMTPAWSEPLSLCLFGWYVTLVNAALQVVA